MCTKFVFQCDLCRVLDEQAPYLRNEEDGQFICKSPMESLFFLGNMVRTLPLCLELMRFPAINYDAAPGYSLPRRSHCSAAFSFELQLSNSIWKK